MEPDIQRELHNLYESLRRIKALAAWERLKHTEILPHRIWAFQMHDPVSDDLRSEYTFFTAGLARLRSALNNHLLNTSEELREAIQRQLAHLQRQAYALGLPDRFGGTRG
jgi:hypothetical protein